MDKIALLQNMIDKNNNIVFFTGAGFSTASNIPDFRSGKGMVNDSNLSFEKILSHRYFINNTKEFYQFYKTNMLHLNALPNIGHNFVAKLENSGKLKACITQNIDGLHTLANCVNTIELHGSIHRNYCLKCNQVYGAQYVFQASDIPLCSCGGIIKCDVVLYDEMLDENNLNRAIDYIYNADVIIVAGTSLKVYPAAGLLKYYRGKSLVIINKMDTDYDEVADLVINDDICNVLSQIKINC